GMGAKKSQIVSAQSYDPGQTTLTQQILALKSAGADTLVIFALPTQTIVSLATAAKVGWSPAVFLGNVSANRLFMLAAAANGANVDGVISTSYLNSSTDPSLANTPGVKLANVILNGYAPSLVPSFQRGDANVMYGLAQGWTFVYALQHAGKNPTRASLVKAYKSLNTSKNPFVYPGIKLQTSATDNFPIEQEILIKWAGGSSGDWQAVGELISGVR
ncbi:MAG TPA: ABC transporter substrate-binding protein, partial [Gaiellaceae bacterium]|nr:ABC transporter substrate-binding protein [Gaiellaceae bacterium]